MKIKELVTKKDNELLAELSKLKADLTKLKFEIASKESTRHTDIPKMQKQIAQINTILRERQIQREETTDEKKA